jgi:hypothetical protein
MLPGVVVVMVAIVIVVLGAIGLGEGELAFAIDGGYGAVDVLTDEVGVDDAGGVGVRDVEGRERRGSVSWFGMTTGLVGG